MGCAFSLNDIGEVALSFQFLSSGGDRGSRMLFAGERGGAGMPPSRLGGIDEMTRHIDTRVKRGGTPRDL